jgi:hypothetical protein
LPLWVKGGHSTLPVDFFGQIPGSFRHWQAKLCPGGALSAVWRLAFIFFPRVWTFWARLVLRYITDPLRWHCTKWSCGNSSSRSIFNEGQVKRRDVGFWHKADMAIALRDVSKARAVSRSSAKSSNF